MATITQIEQRIDELARTVGDDIQALRVLVAAGGGGGSGSLAWNDITGKPLTFTPSAHTHPTTDIQGFEAAVDALIAATAFTVAWADITGKPATFAPSAHTHVVAEITDFTTEVNALIAGAGAGDGNVSGPAGGVVNNEIAVYNGTSGLAIKGSGIVPSADGISLIEAANYAAMVALLGVSTGDVTGPAGGVVDNEIAVYSGTGGKTLKASGITPTANGVALIETNYAGMKALLDLEIGTDVQAWDAQLDVLAGQTWAADRYTYYTGASTAAVGTITAFGRAWLAAGDSDAARGQLAIKEFFSVALSDDSTAITTGANKARWRPPYAIKNVEARAFLKTASSSGLVTVDVNEAGVSILSTKLSIDASELTSTTAATSPVVSDSVIAQDAEVTFDIDAAGTGAVGLVVQLIFERA
jgi:hypothetical protein